MASGMARLIGPEKLVQIIKESLCKHIHLSCNLAENIAGDLIAHGVTVQELDGCEHCQAASYTKKPFTVITQRGGYVKTQFNFCPNCGRKLSEPPKGE